MSLTKIDDIYLYTGLTASANNSFAAKKWFDKQGIEYIFMHYGNEAEHASLFTSLDTWWPGEHTFTDFPFVVYTEIHDDLSFILPLEKLDDYVEEIVTEMLVVNFDFINVPLTVEVSIGENLLEMEEVLIASSDTWRK